MGVRQSMAAIRGILLALHLSGPWPWLGDLCAHFWLIITFLELACYLGPAFGTGPRHHSRKELHGFLRPEVAAIPTPEGPTRAMACTHGPVSLIPSTMARP